ncbi:glycoside hydrolase [Streptomyces sp. NPDC044780]|uniref:glycoside hydrolase n=1 Tax=unclassified Streptomyces TaxID=2593676 RepID=UPI0033DEDCCD
MHRRKLLAAAGGALASGALGPRVARAADATVAVDPRPDFGRHGTWEGWGASLSWWANVLGDRDDISDVLFTTADTPYQDLTLPGLGLNIARYNLGACRWDTVQGSAMVVSAQFPKYKQIEGYWRDWFSEDPASASWDWSADPRQRAAMVKAHARGARIELFSVSPLWWMCVNHCPSGAPDGGDNLQSWNYRQHAVYIATVAAYAAEHWGVPFSSVEPFNEPTSTWWKANGGQEGCHMSTAVQEAVLGHLRTELDTRGLRGTPISASDVFSYDEAIANWQSLDATARAAVGRLTVHGYQGSSGDRNGLYQQARSADKGLWNSETGDGDSTGLTTATNLCLDLNRLHPTAYCYWQPLDTATSWGPIFYDPDTARTGSVQPKYYVLAQFTRHIRPGMRMLATGSDTVVAALDAAAHRLVVVAVNATASAQPLTLDLSLFTTVTGQSGTVPRWSTVTTPAGERYAAHRDTTLDGKRLRLTLEAQSVQTFQIDGVEV